MHTPRQRRGRRSISILAVLAVLITTALSVPAIGQDTGLSVPDSAVDHLIGDKTERTYIVIMAEDPVVAYEGGTAGLAATRPAAGEKVDPNATAVKAYRSHLTKRHDSALANAGVDRSRKVYDYSLALNGFAARMTGVEASKVSRQEGVLAVVENEIMKLDTVTTPDFLGLTAPGGAWDQGYDGENVVIGVLDSGVWPENPAFADVSRSVNPEWAYTSPTRWRGVCQTGDDFTRRDCNDKLIGARYYTAGFGGPEQILADFPYEFISPRDADGHGSHTASTAGGNRGVPVTIDGQALGEASGMAPRARIAVYKVCWGFSGEGGCATSDSVAAIDQAVADGVDVINFSISGTQSDFLSPVEVAFLFATDAGVSVNVSAGNDGPGASTVNHPSPWLTTVAAGTHDRAFTADVTLGNGESYSGASIQDTGTDVLPLVYAGDVGLSGVDQTELELCYPDTLDPALVAGKMVLCDRGVIDRVAKSASVAAAGGLAMILANTSPNSLNADIHSVPTVHVDEVARAAILAYIDAAGADATGQLSPSVVGTDTTAPQVAAFSSRGPQLGSADILKPDIMAPGVDVLAAVSPIGYNGHEWDFVSGTSMSSPHMAGLSAVLAQAHPNWHPSGIKSALMTTANSVSNATPFDVGSGHVDINEALDPGLVYNARFDDYVNFLCGTGQLTGCASPLDPSDLNQPNITVGELAGSQTVTRTVTNVDNSAVYTVSVDAPPGVDVTVSPSTLRVNRNRSASYEVTFTRTTAALDTYAFGTLTWSDGDHEVTSQLVVKPVQLSAPIEVLGSGTEGSGSFDITFGYDGDYVAGAHGLVAATEEAATVVDDPANDINTALATGVGITIHEVSIPTGSSLARFATFDADTDGDDDLDLYVFDSNGAFVAGSGSPTAEERVDIENPTDTTYLVVVHGWQTDGPDSNYTLSSWGVPADATADDGSLVIDSAPTAATLGASGTVSYSWSGLNAGTRYLGRISHGDGSVVSATTNVAVSTK